jgi:hypothetical protein
VVYRGAYVGDVVEGLMHVEVAREYAAEAAEGRGADAVPGTTLHLPIHKRFCKREREAVDREKKGRERKEREREGRDREESEREEGRERGEEERGERMRERDKKERRK